MSSFKTFSMHVTEQSAGQALNSLRAARAEDPSFAGPGPGQAELDPETAARRIVEQALESDALPSFTLPEAGGKQGEVKSLGVETMPLTGTRVSSSANSIIKFPCIVR